MALSQSDFQVRFTAGAGWQESVDVPLPINLGGSQKVAAIREAPLAVPMSDRVLALTGEATSRFTVDRDNSLIFSGEFDVREIALNHGVASGFLAIAYPCSDFDELRGSIGYMDYVGGV